LPDIEAIRELINRQNPGAGRDQSQQSDRRGVSRIVLQASLAELAAEHDLILSSRRDLRSICYDQARFVPMAPLASETLCVSFGGLSKVYRACGWRVGWAVFTGALERARMTTAGSGEAGRLRLSANVPGQWAVQTALGGYQSIADLVGRGGRLHDSRQAVIEAVQAKAASSTLVTPMGAMYAFPSVRNEVLPDFDDHRFAAELLEHKHILIVPGSSFNIPERHYFRITLLPEAEELAHAFARIEDLLEELDRRPPNEQTARTKHDRRLPNQSVAGRGPAALCRSPARARPAGDRTASGRVPQLIGASSIRDRGRTTPSVVEAETLADNALATAWSTISHLNSVTQTPEWREVYPACLEQLTRFAQRAQAEPALFGAYQAWRGARRFRPAAGRDESQHRSRADRLPPRPALTCPPSQTPALCRDQPASVGARQSVRQPCP
jgi:hypothetical protein